MRNLTAVPAISGSHAAAPQSRTALHYCNPVIDRDFPDPAIIRADDGLFYVYATQSGEPWVNIQVARSIDLVTWELLGDALPSKPAWASRTQDFWAPAVFQADGTYYLYYSAKPDIALDDPAHGLCLAVATSSSPAGPFVDSGRPLMAGGGFVNIDPCAFDDPESGKRLLYWGSGFGAIKVQELAEDRISFMAGSSPTDLIEPIPTDDLTEYQRLVEGVWVVRRNGFYYLFYSGANCCGPDAHYAVMVARSTRATGPFELRPRPLHLVVEASERWLAPGHNTVIQDDAGDDWIVYHAIDRLRPQESDAHHVNSRRVLLMDRLEWRDGWPEVAGKVPSATPQTAPVVNF
ncbi:glycoside hydrolase family 43 protein [Sphingomonas sp. GCM10030256]|uniref:glycoside hydrolase family 43 protein n=1 Tax=Sphingomonas sp. GCM10030256 TaxID=3273427 RepID=UPI003623725C